MKNKFFTISIIILSLNALWCNGYYVDAVNAADDDDDGGGGDGSSSYLFETNQYVYSTFCVI